MSYDLATVEARCREAIAEAERAGFVVMPGYAYEDNQRCLLGVVGDNCTEADYVLCAAKELGITRDEAKSLECGFMDWSPVLIVERPSVGLLSLGQTLRAEQLAKHGGAR